MTLFALHFQLDKKIFIHCYFLLVLMPEPALYIWLRCQFCVWYSLAAFRFPVVICRSRSVAKSENLNEQFKIQTMNFGGDSYGIPPPSPSPFCAWHAGRPQLAARSMAAIECLFRCILPHSRKVRVQYYRVASSFVRQQYTRPSEDDEPSEVSIFHI